MLDGASVRMVTGRTRHSEALRKRYGYGLGWPRQPRGGAGGNKYEFRDWVPGETKPRSAPWRSSSAYVRMGKEANLFPASGKVMFSLTLKALIFFSCFKFSQLLE